MTTDTDTQLNQIEISMEQAKAGIARAEALERLLTNRDFQTVIEQGYFVDEASRLVMLRADPDPTHDCEEGQKSLMRRIDAIGQLRQFIIAQRHQGQMYMNSLADSEMTREEILGEG